MHELARAVLEVAKNDRDLARQVRKSVNSGLRQFLRITKDMDSEMKLVGKKAGQA